MLRAQNKLLLMEAGLAVNPKFSVEQLDLVDFFKIYDHAEITMSPSASASLSASASPSPSASASPNDDEEEEESSKRPYQPGVKFKCVSWLARAAAVFVSLSRAQVGSVQRATP